MDGHGGRVLVLIAQVDHHRFRHEFGCFLRHPGVDERGQVQGRLAVEREVRVQKLPIRARMREKSALIHTGQAWTGGEYVPDK